MNNMPKQFVPLLLASSGFALASAPAMAAGVPAGTLIENTATASYDSGGGTQSIDSNTVSLRVDELLDVAVATRDGALVTIRDSAVLAFSVTNTGNGPESYVLTASNSVSGNDFDSEIDGLAIDTNGNRVYDEGVDTLLANGATSTSIAADGAITVFVLVSAPTGISDGDSSQVQLTAAASTGTGAPGRVFSGAGEGGGDAVVGASGADDDDRGRLAASFASLTLAKTGVVSDPFGGSEPVPGATITYTIRASASGSGDITGLVISDNYPTGTTYAPGTLRLGSANLTDGTDSDAGEAGATGIVVRAGTLAAGANQTVTFDVVID